MLKLEKTMKTLFKISFTILFVVSFFLISGCKKKKIPEGFILFEGKWKHQYSLVTYQDNFTWVLVTDTVYPKNDYFIEFLKKGELHFIKNNDLVEKYCIKEYNDTYAFIVDNKEYYQLSFRTINNSIQSGDYPFPYYESGHPHPNPSGIANYFVKIN